MSASVVTRQLMNAVVSSKDKEELNSELEYSFAVEYDGPPVSYNIPRALPVDIDHIPTAAPVSLSCLLHNLSLPTIQPIWKSNGRFHCKLVDQAKLTVDLKTDKGLCNDGGGSSGGSSESGVSSRSVSSEVFSSREEGGVNEIQEIVAHHVKRPSIVTFRDPDTSEVVLEVEGLIVNSDGEDEEEEESVEVRPRAERIVGKKGSCYRCGRGNKFTEKEVCIVCGAKYCCDCVLRAMGAMPEGRKCVTCTRFRIDESRRGSVGKCSWMLRRLLGKALTEAVMIAEISCQVNQLPGNLVFVNEEPLTQEELVRLQGCRNPPKKLKPGCYWYDNVSGFWGKDGHKPCQIISPHLNVGGHIKQNASNGDTEIIINNRRITKFEVFMLKMAGVPCEGNLNYWVEADGTYMEEGMKTVKGKIWDMKTKLVCSLLSLPVPIASKILPAEDERNLIDAKQLKKLLLVGYHNTGSSTIFKQAKFLYNVPFSGEERQNIKLMIQSRLYSYLCVLLEGREWFEEEGSLVENRRGYPRDVITPSGITSQLDRKITYTISPRLKSFADWLLNLMISNTLEAFFPAAAREYAPVVEELWKDPAIQATYNRRKELEMLPCQAGYFLNQAVEISRTDYEPTYMDILYAEGITASNSLTTMEFSFTTSSERNDLDSFYHHDPLQRFQLVRVASLGGSCKLVEMFEDVDMVIFCVGLTDYDEFCEDINGVSRNKMMASKQLFESIATHHDQKHFLLILNKFDLLEEKIEQCPLNRCEWFHDFNPATSHNPSSSDNNTNNPTLAHRAFQYIAMKFKRTFHSLTDRKLFVSLVTALESDSVDKALRYAREILRCEEDVPRLVNDFSSASIDASSTA